MKSKVDETIKNIDRGAIDFYYALKIESDLKYNKLCKAIDEYNNAVYKEYDEELHKEFKTTVMEAKNELDIGNEIKLVNAKPCFWKKMFIRNEKRNTISKKNIQRIELDSEGAFFKFIPVTDIHEHLKNLRDTSNNDYQYCKCVYGDFYVNCQTRFILPSFKIELISGATVFSETFLYVFENNSAVLRITLPIEDVDIDPLLQNDISIYIKSITSPFSSIAAPEENSVSAIFDFYYDYIRNVKKIRNIILCGELGNIILANHNSIPDDIKQMSSALKEKLYKIVVAPFQERKNTSYKEEAIEYIKNNNYTVNGLSYITSNMGKCVSVVDKNVIEFAKENFTMDIEDEFKEDVAFGKIISDTRQNVEYTFVMLMLKKINYFYTFYKKSNYYDNSHKIRLLFNNDIIFINTLQNGCYGSVREQLVQFEQKMAYFLDSKNTIEKMDAIDSIINGEKEQRNSSLQNIISVLGLLFTGVFGLPAINETLSLIRNICTFIRYDIPYLTVNNCSIVIWSALLVVLSFMLFSKLYRLKKIKHIRM